MRCILHEMRENLMTEARQVRMSGGNYQLLVEAARQINWRIVARLREG